VVHWEEKLNRRQDSKKDKVLLFQAGEEGKKFCGSVILFSSLQLRNRASFTEVIMHDINLWRKSV
jgi:hypothetical protein